MKTIYLTPFKRIVSCFLIAVLLFQTTGCSYYKVKKLRIGHEATINDIGKLHKYFVVHHKDKVYSITGLTVDSTAIYGILNDHAPHFYKDGLASKINSGEKDIVNEVHIYLRYGSRAISLEEESSILLSDITELRIVEFDTKRTIAVFVVSAVGTVLALYALLVVIILLTKSSCPYIYVKDGDGFVFEGEIFGGAIGENLERDDYMPLPSIELKEGSYHLRISNELKERQFTDIAELVLVNHDSGENVLLDKTGQPHIIKDVQSFKEAKGLDFRIQEDALRVKDYNKYLFDNTLSHENGVILNFEKPLDSKTGKLVINANNSLWFDYMVGEVFEKMGASFDLIMERNAKQPIDKIKELIKGHEFPLAIYIKKKNNWELVDYINTVGPLASRDFVVPIDVSDIQSNEVTIKLETGFMFWELDYVGIDFTRVDKPKIKVLKPHLALGTGSINWTHDLSEIDGEYMAQENVGEITEVVYKIPPELQQENQAVFLHTRGYYELIRDFEGLPQISDLEKF